MLKVLPSRYYLTNFRVLVNFVGSTYSSLLSDAEQHWMRTVLQVSDDAQALYVRLLSRRASVFRVSKLKYPEITNLNEAIHELSVAGLVHTQPPSELVLLLQLLTKPELLELPQLMSWRSRSKRDIITHLLALQDITVLQNLQARDHWITALGESEFRLFSLCFFGNGHQDMTEFVLRDLGLMRFELYVIDSESKAFHSRAQIQSHLDYVDYLRRYESIDKKDSFELVALGMSLGNVVCLDERLARRLGRLRNRIARHLERLECYSKALVLYQQSPYTPSRERQTRIHLLQGQYAEAQLLCSAMLQSPLNDEEQQIAQTLSPKVAKASGLSVPKSIRFKPEKITLTLVQTDDRVEESVRLHYAQQGRCFYVENALINSVLGLYIWDIIYLPVHGVFYNPFQSAPADFYQPEFLKHRDMVLQQRFLELNDVHAFSERVLSNFASRQGIVNPLVSWQWISAPLLELALQRIPLQHWRGFFIRILADLRNNSTGLPDLVHFPHESGYQLLEVKGPGDTVQKNQLRWMQHFSDSQVPYQVVHVVWQSADSA